MAYYAYCQERNLFHYCPKASNFSIFGKSIDIPNVLGTVHLLCMGERGEGSVICDSSKEIFLYEKFVIKGWGGGGLKMRVFALRNKRTTFN